MDQRLDQAMVVWNPAPSFNVIESQTVTIDDLPDDYFEDRAYAHNFFMMNRGNFYRTFYSDDAIYSDPPPGAAQHYVDMEEFG